MSDLATYYTNFDRTLNNRFKVIIKDHSSGETAEIGLSKVSGLEDSSVTATYREGNEGDAMHTFMGLSETGVVTLERAISNTEGTDDLAANSSYFVDWRDKCRNLAKTPSNGPEGNNESKCRRLVKVETLDHEGNVISTTKAFNALCTKVTVPDSDAEANDIMKEIIEVTPEAVRRVVGSD